MKKILIVAATHGHETLGVGLLEKIKGTPFIQNVDTLIGNERALAANTAYIESDLNRVFPGKINGTYEERRAYEISKVINNYDIVIDIHSTNTTTFGENSMLIVTKINKVVKKCISIIKPPKLVYMNYMNKNALISGAKAGIAFEYGSNNDRLAEDAILDAIYTVLEYFGNLPKKNACKEVPFKNEIDIYEVYDVYSKIKNKSFTLDSQIQNFYKVIKGQRIGNYEDNLTIKAEESFYPILFGENRYKKIIGFKAKKCPIKINEKTPHEHT